MRVGEISIQCQRMFAFGDALRRALGESNVIWPSGWSGTTDRALVDFASAAAKAAIGSLTNKNEPSTASAPADPISRVYIVGIGGERATEKAARLGDNLSGVTPLLNHAIP